VAVIESPTRWQDAYLNGVDAPAATVPSYSVGETL